MKTAQGERLPVQGFYFDELSLGQSAELSR
ncbi:MAG: hypothetical protein JWQ46_6, partial [Phenylobacterium sp.]|nr:hypothetical protein [Phenylobacterium sp.]